MCPRFNGIISLFHTSSSWPGRTRGLALVTQEVNSGSELRWLPWDQSLDYPVLLSFDSMGSAQKSY